jgi:outer membrane protein assembly factor BamB
MMCLDRESGKVLWSNDAIQGKPRLGTHRDNTYASETPVTDGSKIVAYFGALVYSY